MKSTRSSVWFERGERGLACVGLLGVTYISAKALGVCSRYIFTRVDRTPSNREKPLSVVITGSTKGIGLAMARAHLRLKDSVVISSRNEERVNETVAKLSQEFPNAKVFGFAANVREEKQMLDLARFAKRSCGQVNAFVCNAGVGQPAKRPLTEVSEDEITTIVGTNLLGTVNSYKAAVRECASPEHRTHVFFMEGAGSGLQATANFAAYGLSKAPFRQMLKTLQKEAAPQNVSVHILQPGMVITDLLMANKGAKAYWIFNILAEMPHTVADWLVPRVRGVSRTKKTGSAFRYLTGPSVAWRFLTMMFRKNRLIDAKTGRVVA